MAFDPVKMKMVLNSFGSSVVSDAKKNLDSKTGNLESKISFAARVMPNSMSLNFDLGEYGQGIDRGIKGSGNNEVNTDTPFKFVKKNPSQAMINNLSAWADRAGFQPFSKDRKFVMKHLGRIILSRGIQPTHFFKNAYEKHFRTLDKDLVEAFGLDVDDFFEFVFKK